MEALNLPTLMRRIVAECLNSGVEEDTQTPKVAATVRNDIDDREVDGYRMTLKRWKNGTKESKISQVPSCPSEFDLNPLKTFVL